MEDARVVVTGASRGLGRVVAEAFVAAGNRVALVARDRERLDEVANELGGTTMVCSADVSIPESNEEVASAVAENWGGIDVWIANAGISPVVGGPCETPVDDWRQVMATNVDGVFYGVRAAVPVMRAGGGGRIIVTGSVLGERPRKGLGAYSAAKAAVNGMVRAFAQDLAPDGITVNAVAPGWFDSPLAASWKRNPRLEKQILDHTALRRWGAPEDLPGAFLFLASDAAAYMTGSIVTVDGGYTCA